MARKRLTEFTAKKLVYSSLGLESKNASLKTTSLDTDITQLEDSISYVIKVDQGVKKRMKKGLVKVNVTKEQVDAFIKEQLNTEYIHFFAEEFIPHEEQDEKFLSLERTREGVAAYYSYKGGINVEENAKDIKKIIISDTASIQSIATELNAPLSFIQEIVKVFNLYYFSFLEINPLVIKDNNVYILDLAVEVDSTAEFFVKNAWKAEDFTDTFSLKNRPEEKAILQLAQESQAAFTFEILNPDGAVVVLLSGGGASLVIADEVYNLGYGKELANYGEYSGNPNAEETYIYAKNVLSLLLSSKAKKKVLLIGGGVANFTDIRVTFKGLLKALHEIEKELQRQDIGIFVRRGGPHQDEGLKMLQDFITNAHLKGEVYGPNVMLTEIVKKGIGYIK